MTPLLFCFTGWMEKYRGLDAQQDELIGGGAYPDEHGVGGEICNFVECNDGNTYGFFESGDHQTNISRLGASANDEWIDGVNVVWMAASPDDGKRKCTGIANYLDRCLRNSTLVIGWLTTRSLHLRAVPCCFP